MRRKSSNFNKYGKIIFKNQNKTILLPPQTTIQNHIMKCRFLTGILLLVCMSFAWAGKYTITTVPNPKNEYSDSFVSDPDGFLSKEAVLTLDSVIGVMRSAAGVEVAIVMVEDYDTDHYGAYDFALKLFNYWGVGSAESNSGVLVFFALSTRDIYIITGDGVEGLLPDMACGDILDRALPYLSDGDYDRGMKVILSGIYKRLMTDDARAELLLGYKPQSTEAIEDITTYFIIAFIVLALLAIGIYHNAPQKAPTIPLEDRERMVNKLSSSQTIAGCLSLIFPLPILFLYLYMIYRRKSIHRMTAYCPDCGSTMLINSKRAAEVLSQGELKEVEIKSRIHDVWECPNCRHIEVASYDGSHFHSYLECPACGAITDKEVGQHIVTRATTVHTGKRQTDYRCLNCGHIHSIYNIIPVVPVLSSGRSSGGGFSSGGSWGGGHSSGGGAGRHF